MHGWTEPIDDGGPRRPAPGGPEPYPDAPSDPDPIAATAWDAPASVRWPVAEDLPGDEDDVNRPGRHRARRRGPRRSLAGPLALGGMVTALLILLGMGAAFLPANFAGDERQAAPPPTQDTKVAEDSYDTYHGPIGEDTSPAPSAAPTASATANPSPSVTRAPQTAAPAPRKTPAASRTTQRVITRSSRTATNGTADSREGQVVAIVNRERAAAGCGAVQINAALATAARLHSQDQAATNNMSHTGSDGSSFVERARQAGYQNPIGENVAMGYRTPDAVMQGWMNSDGHRRNILNCQAKAIGVGVAAAADGSLYWTQVFGSTV